jgi:hypothetical protein
VQPVARKPITILVVLAALAVWPLIGAGGAQASSWTSLQCSSVAATGAPDAVDFNSGGSSFSTANNCTSADFASRELRVDTPFSSVSAGYGEYAGLAFGAPSGTIFTDACIDANLVATGSTPEYYPALYYSAAGATQIFAQGNHSNWATYCTGGGHQATLLAGSLSCADSTGCSPAGGRLQMADLNIAITDTVAPATPTSSGSLVSQTWVRGTRNLSVDAFDDGAGVGLLAVGVNGQVPLSHDPCDEVYVPGSGGKTLRLKPCASSVAHSFNNINTTQDPFNEGVNAVSICAAEFGGNPQVTCDNRAINVDNVAPANPENLAVAGGASWRSTNDFDISWDNPAADSFAPYDGAVYELVNPQGQIVAGPTTVGSGGAVESIDDIEAPKPGQYTLRVRLRDAAGNESGNATVTLRFDPNAPSLPKPDRLNGWLSRSELAKPYVQKWRRAVGGMSGVHGYATLIDRNPNTDPCASDGVPGICSDPEINHVGEGSIEQVISDLPEGADNFFHVATVSGAGVPSDVDHVQLKVDKTDPTVELSGLPQGYANQPVVLRADAVDALSGMQPSADDPDGPPETCIEVDGHATCSVGDEATFTINTDGAHTIRCWARDLAGNQPNSDQIQTATVKVDLTLSNLEIAFNAKRKVRAGRKARFSGLVRAPHTELNLGKLVEIQVKVGKRWKTIGEAFRTQPDGTFAYKYRFRKFYTRPTRFKFRLKVLPEQGWPYGEPIYSSKRKIKVVPRKSKTS